MSNEQTKLPVNYHEAAETLKKILGLKGSPVAIRFAPLKTDIPAGMVELDTTIRALFDGKPGPEIGEDLLCPR